MRVETLRAAEEVLPGGMDCVLLDLGLPDAMGFDGSSACAPPRPTPGSSSSPGTTTSKADDELRRRVYDAFQLAVELDRNRYD